MPRRMNPREQQRIMQRMGLEWLFRLITEPRRLWKRYLKQNPRFLALLIVQLLRGRAHPDEHVVVQ